MAVRALLVSYCGAFLVSAALMFTAQPMIAKMVLPIYGDSSCVWTTCMLFFQTTLLAGYVYSYVITRRFSLGVQFLLHLVLVSVPFFILPFAIPSNWDPTSNVDPSWTLSWLLALMAAAPMFVISTSAPLFQRWFAETTHSSAQDPYFLYAVSNAGSMIALVSYPFVIEPVLGLSEQARYWMVGYVILVSLVVLCMATTWKLRRDPVAKAEDTKAESTSIHYQDRLWWIVLAFVPSSWMLSVTTRLTTDIAPMPLLWILPLALYLLTFILVFARKQFLPHSLTTKLLPFAILLLVASQIVELAAIRFILNLLAFFVAAMFCHGELSRRRPAVDHLPEFYLWMSVGGALGGLFNAIVAPQIFSVLLEFPIAVALTSFLHPGRSSDEDQRFDLACIAVTTGGIVLLIRNLNVGLNLSVIVLVITGLLVLLMLYYARMPKPFAALLAAVMVWAELHSSAGGELVHTQRSFYGIHRVVIDNEHADTRFRYLLHGTTQHGFQNTTGADSATTPLGYYHRAGPLGDVMTAYSHQKDDQQQIAVIGLGVGATSCYASTNRDFTFYEVDPVVAQIAETREYFSYLSDSGADYEIILGDGRSQISKATDGEYHIIMLDAFSSDSIPTHLLTRQAVEIYESKLAHGGILVFHVSNIYLDLKRVLGNVARDANLTAYVKEDLYLDEDHIGKSPSTYVVMARKHKDLRPLLAFENWQRLEGQTNVKPWTDDYSNLFGVLKWSSSPVDDAINSQQFDR